jgi:hypothetical protein
MRQQGDLTQDQYEESVRRLTGGSKSRMESPADSSIVRLGLTPLPDTAPPLAAETPHIAEFAG